MAGPAARASRRRRVTLRILLGVRGLERLPRRAGRAGLGPRARGVPRGERLLDRRLGAGGGSVADQVRFDREWSALREYARERGDRPDRRRPDLRRAGQRRSPDPSGALPDRASWPALRRTRSARSGSTGAIRSSTGTRSRSEGYRWWIERLRRTFALLRPRQDRPLPRLRRLLGDPGGPDEPDARTGHWLPGPGESVFRAAEAELGELPVIAEDLGVITKDVEVLRDALGFPGMVVLLWAFQGPARQPAPAREPPRAPGDLHHDPRHGHAARPPAGPASRGS